MTWILPDTHGFPTWEAWAIDHLSRTCDSEPSCDLHQQWEAHQSEAAATQKKTVEERITAIEDRMEANVERLKRANEALADFYRINATNADPASINLSIKRRAGSVTERKIDQHKRLVQRVNGLSGRIARDRQRLARLREDGAA